MSNLSQAEIDALLNQGSSGGTGAAADSGGGTTDFAELENELKKLDKSDKYLTEEEKDILGEIGNICMGASATTMYTLIGHRVTITTPRVSVYTSEEVLSVYNTPFVIVKVEYRSGLEGKNLLILKEDDSVLITELLMGSENPGSTGATLDEIHLSAMSEIMNQMIGSSATSMSNMLGVPIDITPPEAIKVGEETDVSPFLDGSQLVIKVSFDMEIEGVLKSELMQIMSIGTGKKLAEALMQPHGNTAREVRPPEGQSALPAVASGSPTDQKKDEKKERVRTVSVKPVKFEPFDSEPSPKKEMARSAAIDLIGDIPLQVAVELGKTKKSINDIMTMGVGSVVVLDKMAGELVEVIVNGKRIARGEVVVIDENYGVRITDIIARDEGV